MEKVHKHFLSSKDNTSKISLRQNMTPLSYQRKSDRESAQTFFKPKDNASFHLQIKPIILPRKFKEENI